MKIINPSYEILTDLNGAEILQTVERAARTCYKSEDKITDDSAHKLVSKLIERGHEAMLEHCSFSVKFICNRGVTHELVRHRLCAYAQECVAGSTLVRKGISIRDVFERKNTSYGRAHLKTLRLRSCNDQGVIIPNKIKEVFHKGKAPVFKVTTSLGYTIKATGAHEFATDLASFSRLENLTVGDSILVNGRPSLLCLEDTKLKNAYLVDKLSPQEISVKFGAPYRSVVTRLKKAGIFVARMNDKDPEKYTCNHTEESYKRMQKTIIRQYQDGRKPWNKDLTESEHPSVAIQANNLRSNHHDNDFGDLNSNWQGGVSQSYYSRIVDKDECELCGRKAIEIHHKDLNRRNNTETNLIPVCINCHKKLHHGWHIGDVAHTDTIISIEAVGVEDVYDLEMEHPWHNYVADGFVVHNSTRYVNYSKGEAGGEITVVRPPVFENSVEALWEHTTATRPELMPPGESIWVQAMLKAEENYLAMIAAGFPPQIARGVLPIDVKTEIVCTANLREWRHIFKMRADKPAHPSMRQLMKPLLIEVTKEIPLIFDDRYQEYCLGDA